MRKLIVLLWVVFLPITSAIAQSNENEQDIHVQIKDWAAVKLTIAYIEDLRHFTPEKKGKNDSEKEYKTYKVLIDKYETFSNEINLESVSQLLLTGGWETTKEVVFDGYRKIEVTSDFDFNQIQALGYTDGISKDNFNETISVLNDKYKDLLKEKYKVDEKSKSNESLEDNNIGNSKVETINQNPMVEASEVASVFSVWTYVFFGALIAAIVVIILLISKINSLNKSLKKGQRSRSKDTPIDDLFSPTADKLRKENKELESANRNLISKMHEYKKEIENLKNNPISEVKQTVENIPLVGRSVSIDLDLPQQKSSNLIYLSSPFQNLTFANEDSSKEKTSNSLYLVEFNEQMQTGVLSVIVDADLSKALNSPDTYLETACTYDNEYSNNARAIKVTETGEIKLEGEDWIVTKKVRIKFI
jgi:uncharacterized membrane protein